MARWKILALAAAGSAAAFALTAAQRPAALANASPGLWEVSGLPGVKSPVRQCVAEVGALAQFEHRQHNCTRNIVRDDSSSTVIQYSCGGAGFGRSTITVLTPRSLRIDTQGISDNLPFGYVLQARRIGDCPERA